jgi:NAD(P)-dependent dehydrogenase (short-subunit alcohol dehydrogenase family)
MPEQGAKRWFITGVSSGFGRELARLLVKDGDAVIGTVRSDALVRELTDEGIDAIVMDVNEQAGVDAAVATVRSRWGQADVVVNNAGFGMAGAVEALTLDEVRAVMETNFFGVVRVTQAFIPMMRENGGAIVMISSVAGHVGFAGMGAYCASKFALEGISEALATELEPFGVHVMLVEPGLFRTDFSRRSIQGSARSIDVYAGVQAGEARNMMVSYAGNEPGDPVKAARAIVTALEAEKPPLHLALGADAVEEVGGKLDRVRQDLETWRPVSIATHF